LRYYPALFIKALKKILLYAKILAWRGFPGFSNFHMYYIAYLIKAFWFAFLFMSYDVYKYFLKSQ